MEIRKHFKKVVYPKNKHRQIKQLINQKLMSNPKYCNLCNRNVIPGKKFNWLVFFLLCGIFYVPYYFLKKDKCPICDSDNFSPAKATEMGK